MPGSRRCVRLSWRPPYSFVARHIAGGRGADTWMLGRQPDSRIRSTYPPLGRVRQWLAFALIWPGSARRGRFAEKKKVIGWPGWAPDQPITFSLLLCRQL